MKGTRNMTATIAREVTDWYSKTIKPVRPGWYETKWEGVPGTHKRWFDGQVWLFRPGDHSSMCFFGMKGSRDKWRGLRSPAC